MTIAPLSTFTTKVAIIGAGASGLSQIKQLLDAFARDDVRAAGKAVEIVCFEKNREVGGVWYVDEEKVRGKNKAYQSAVLPVRGGPSSDTTAENDNDGGELERLVIYPKASDEGDEPSPMYDGLRTNLPHVSARLVQHNISRSAGPHNVLMLTIGHHGLPRSTGTSPRPPRAASRMPIPVPTPLILPLLRLILRLVIRTSHPARGPYAHPLLFPLSSAAPDAIVPRALRPDV